MAVTLRGPVGAVAAPILTAVANGSGTDDGATCWWREPSATPCSWPGGSVLATVLRHLRAAGAERHDGWGHLHHRRALDHRPAGVRSPAVRRLLRRAAAALAARVERLAGGPVGPARRALLLGRARGVVPGRGRGPRSARARPLCARSSRPLIGARPPRDDPDARPQRRGPDRALPARGLTRVGGPPAPRWLVPVRRRPRPARGGRPAPPVGLTVLPLELGPALDGRDRADRRLGRVRQPRVVAGTAVGSSSPPRSIWPWASGRTSAWAIGYGPSRVRRSSVRAGSGGSPDHEPRCRVWSSRPCVGWSTPARSLQDRSARREGQLAETRLVARPGSSTGVTKR